MAMAILLTASLGSLFGPYCDDMKHALASQVKGEVVVPSDNGTYDEAIQQYAYTSMPEKLHPSGVVYVLNADDVKAAVQYAWLCDYLVTVRSGGHQYMGLSSCDSSEHKCMQIDLSNITTLSISDTTVRVGAGVSLLALYETLSQSGLFVSAGECATVHVGGHAQTGGYGFLSRSFGTLADHVVAFDIVLADGELHHITKPQSGGSRLSENDRLFWAVLGGGAGSWGVVTEYVIEAHKDSDYSQSTYYRCLVPWNSDVFADMVRAMDAVTSDAAWDTNHDEALWMSTMKTSPIGLNFVMFEGVWVGHDGKAFDNSTYTAFVNAVAGRGQCFAFSTTLSVAMAQYKTFRGAREFPTPYIKRSRASKATSLGEDTATVLAEQFDAIMSMTGLFFISQLTTVGGMMLDMERNSDIALPLRSVRYNLDIGVFYSEELNSNAKADAIAYQDTIWAEVDQLPAFQQDIRYVWATFGDVHIQDVWKLYYEDKRYHKLRAVKTKVDPFDIFRTTFTIPALWRS